MTGHRADAADDPPDCVMRGARHFIRVPRKGA